MQSCTKTHKKLMNYQTWEHEVFGGFILFAQKSSNGEMNNGLLSSSVYQESVYLEPSPTISHSSAAIYPPSGYSTPSYSSATLAQSASEDNKDVKQWSRTIAQFQVCYQHC